MICIDQLGHYVEQSTIKGSVLRKEGEKLEWMWYRNVLYVMQREGGELVGLNTRILNKVVPTAKSSTEFYCAARHSKISTSLCGTISQVESPTLLVSMLEQLLTKLQPCLAYLNPSSYSVLSC